MTRSIGWLVKRNTPNATRLELLPGQHFADVKVRGLAARACYRYTTLCYTHAHTSTGGATMDLQVDAITATSYGGIAEANLVDKSVAEFMIGAWDFSAGLRTTNGSTFGILNSTGTDRADFDHDGTDFNTTFINTTDWNITGITAIQAGAVDVDFDAITATSYGGITEGDLLDKSADEIVSGEWNIPSAIQGKTASYTLVIGDAGQTIRFTGSTASKVLTIPANGSVAFTEGTLIAIHNDGTVDMTVAITTDTLTWAKNNTTGTRTLAPGATAIIQKVASTAWKIAGSALVS